MKPPRALAFLALPLLGACAARPMLHPEVVKEVAMIPADDVLEMRVDASGRILETEVHTTPDRLPELVRAAAERVVPGGVILTCEKEHHGGRVYWEVEKRVGGLKREVMFTPGGDVVSTEFEIAIADAPARILAAADTWVRGGEITSVEEVRRDGGLEYHVKKSAEGLRYKLVFTPGGEFVVGLRELPAEIEVPLVR